MSNFQNLIACQIIRRSSYHIIRKYYVFGPMSLWTLNFLRICSVQKLIRGQATQNLALVNLND